MRGLSRHGDVAGGDVTVVVSVTVLAGAVTVVVTVAVDASAGGGVVSDVASVDAVLDVGLAGNVAFDRLPVGVASEERVAVAPADWPPFAPQLARKPATKSASALLPRSSGRSALILRSRASNIV